MELANYKPNNLPIWKFYNETQLNNNPKLQNK